MGAGAGRGLAGARGGGRRCGRGRRNPRHSAAGPEARAVPGAPSGFHFSPHTGSRVRKPGRPRSACAWAAQVPAVWGGGSCSPAHSFPVRKRSPFTCPGLRRSCRFEVTGRREGGPGARERPTTVSCRAPAFLASSSVAAGASGSQSQGRWGAAGLLGAGGPGWGWRGEDGRGATQADSGDPYPLCPMETAALPVRSPPSPPQAEPGGLGLIACLQGPLHGTRQRQQACLHLVDGNAEAQAQRLVQGQLETAEQVQRPARGRIRGSGEPTTPASCPSVQGPGRPHGVESDGSHTILFCLLPPLQAGGKGPTAERPLWTGRR